MTIDRVKGLSSHAFITYYLQPNQPVIVTDATAEWAALRHWSPDYLCEKFGNEKVQIYDDLFFLTKIRTLSDYVARYVSAPTKAAVGSTVPYVRWYSRQNARSQLPWSDNVLDRLASDWNHPTFMPQTELLLPFDSANAPQSPVRDKFPARAIFLSAIGARTRLHADPWASDALLCQVHGEKRFLLFEPHQTGTLTRDVKLIDIRYDVGSDAWKDLPEAPFVDDCLRPGEIILIPAGWAHTFHSRTTSISLTWNFVHHANLPRFAAYLRSGVNESEAQSLAYFLDPSSRKGEDVASEQRMPSAAATK